MDVVPAQGMPRADVSEAIAVGATVRRRRRPDGQDDDRLAAGVAEDGVVAAGHGGTSGRGLNSQGAKDAKGKNNIFRYPLFLSLASLAPSLFNPPSSMLFHKAPP